MALFKKHTVAMLSLQIVDLTESYKSLFETLTHAGIHANSRIIVYGF